MTTGDSEYEAAQQIFLGALELKSPEERAHYLDEACGEDTALRESLEALLQEYEEGGGSVNSLAGDGTDPANVALFLPGVILAERYRIVSLLGKGGMGEVYRADDLKLEQPVALKFLPPALAGDQALLKALYNEVRLARQVSHRHVGRMYDIGEAEGQHFLSMEYIEGEDLGGLLRQIGRLPLDKALQLGSQLCAGLQAAHEEGLLHLDLKPANLMIDGRGDLRIMDFGLARLISDGNTMKQRVGTPAYMAPEHRLKGVATERCDLYAVGLILLEMVTGKRTGPDRDNEALKKLNPDLRSLIQACTAEDPDKRPAAVSEVLGPLQDIGSSGSSTYTAATPSPGRQTAVLFFSDVVDSVGLQKRLGSNLFAEQIQRHDQLFHQVVEQSDGGKVLQHTGDGFMISFPTASEAVSAALRLQWLFREEGWLGEPMRLRIGLHLGEVLALLEKNTSELRPVGMATNLAARIMGLAEPSQILMTRAVYDDARQFVRTHPAMPGPTADLEWLSHGAYEIKGNDEPVEIFETGMKDVAPLRAPPSSEKAAPVAGLNRSESPDEHPMTIDEIKEADVFISYASVDNEPLTEGKQGWVTQFHRNLELRAQQLLGEKVTISRPPKTVGCDDIEESVLEFLPEVKAMVSVISPPFAHSTGCQRELSVFHEGVGDRFRIDNQPRLLPAVKTPVDAHELTTLGGGALEGLSGFEFYEKDPGTGRIREFEEAFGAEARQRYYERVYDLAFDLCNTLKACRRVWSDGVSESSSELSTGITVYLAATTSDLEPHNDRLRRELLEQGHQVLPNAPLPFHHADLENVVSEYLNRSDCVIQIVGPTYGMVPENARHSLLELQNTWCTERIEANGIPRFIWMPRDMAVEDDRQLAFVTQLREVDAAQQDTELLEGTLSAFRDRVVQRLHPSEEEDSTVPEEPSSNEASGGPPLLYLICDQGDEEHVEALEDYLFEKGLQVDMPEFAAEQSEVSAMHREQLKECDAVMIYYGVARKAWVDIKLRDLIKANGYGREKPIAFQSVYVAPPEDRRKERFRAHGVQVIRQPNESFESNPDLDAFIATIMKKEVVDV